MAKTVSLTPHPGVELKANLKSISHRCLLFEVAFVWELTKESIHLPRGCLQGGWIAKDTQVFLCGTPAANQFLAQAFLARATLTRHSRIVWNVPECSRMFGVKF